jgi:hypothetical protein
MPERYEYRVVEVRESMVGGKMSGGKLEKLLNEHASQGWQLKAITSADVKGRVGPGGTEGLLVTFERRIGVGHHLSADRGGRQFILSSAVTAFCRCSRLRAP